ncbi:MAG: IS66 family transposase [Bdellovibrionales bacterium]|nr:IS66 family transposase [Bdellovibrionales bacterium]
MLSVRAQVIEFFESQNSTEFVDKNELFRLLQKSQLNEKYLHQDNDRLRSKVNRLEAIIQEFMQGNLDISMEKVLEQERRAYQAALFGKSSERSSAEEIAANSTASDDLVIPGADDPGEAGGSGVSTHKRLRLPSVRYPKAEVTEVHVAPERAPQCPCCSKEMKDSGLTETSEKVTVIPRKVLIERQIRHKFGCPHCHGAIVTAALPPSLVPGGSYSDALLMDVAIAKYFDLMPIQRYIRAAERCGVIGLPSASLIEGTHVLASRLRVVYRLLKQEVLREKVLNADETPHRMLEGADRDSWFFWGFLGKTAAYFEAHETRSGDVASEFLKASLCEYLVSDVYSGYAKAVRETNEGRAVKTLPSITCVYCNAHARRYFKKAKDAFAAESQFFIDRYMSIYFLESQLKKLRTKDPHLPTERVLEIRGKMRQFYEQMKARAETEQFAYSDKSSIAKAMNYFLKNYEGLTLFLTHADLPIDNNAAERILRNPVIGRKTWYGTHSPQGAETAVVLFSIFESCKLNGVNPQAYLKRLVQSLHRGEPLFTPATYKTALNA